MDAFISLQFPLTSYCSYGNSKIVLLPWRSVNISPSITSSLFTKLFSPSCLSLLAVLFCALILVTSFLFVFFSLPYQSLATGRECLPLSSLHFPLENTQISVCWSPFEIKGKQCNFHKVLSSVALLRWEQTQLACSKRKCV